MGDENVKRLCEELTAQLNYSFDTGKLRAFLVALRRLSDAADHGWFTATNEQIDEVLKLSGKVNWRRLLMEILLEETELSFLKIRRKVPTRTASGKRTQRNMYRLADCSACGAKLGDRCRFPPWRYTEIHEFPFGRGIRFDLREHNSAGLYADEVEAGLIERAAVESIDVQAWIETDVK